MTIGLVFAGSQGIVLASDCKSSSFDRGVEGDSELFHRVQKVFKISEHCGIVCSGLHGVGEKLSEALKAKHAQSAGKIEDFLDDFKSLALAAVRDVIPVSEDFELWRRRWLNEGSQSPPKDVEDAIKSIQKIYAASFHTQFLLTGLSRDGDSQVHQANNAWEPYAPRKLNEKYGVIGVTNVARYWLARIGAGESWDHSATALEDFDRVAMFLICETAALAGSVCLPMQLAHITEGRGFEWVINPPPTPPNDYHKQLKQHCESLIEGLCSQFTRSTPHT